MSYIFRYLLCLLLFVTVKQTAQAQGRFPITASTQIIPPYSVYLPDYAVPGSDKLRVILVQNDLTQPSYDIRLEMTVERNGAVIMRSAPTFRPKALTLNAGVPTIIGGTDLYDYLQTQNIVFSNGFSANDYERTKSLPEGAYRITFTAFDYNRPQVQVSNAGANIFFFQKNDPPLLNLPVCGSRVEKHDPQFLTFNWSSRNTPSPFANSATEYVFSLYEIKPKGSNADYILRSARPLYTTVTETNTIVYGPGEPTLIDSMEYVWVVQARDKSGRDLFSNQGLSQSCKFTYLGANPFAANNIGKPKFYGKATGERTIHLYWPLAPESVFYDVEAYRVQYRAAKKDGVEFDWHTEEKQRDTVLDLNSLEPGHTYEAQLQWKVAGVYGPLSELLKITTDTARAFDCSDAGPVSPAANAKPLASASVGNIVKNGFFDVILTEVSGSNGTFSGKGRIITPGFGIGLSLTFKNITINENMVVTKGEMQAVTEGINKFTSDAVKEERGGNDVGQVKTGDIVPDIPTNLHIFGPQQIKVDTAAGTITLTDKDGNPQETINYQDKGKTLPLVVEDADGNLYNIDKNGHVTAAGTRNSELAGNTTALAALDNLRLDKGQVTFAAGTGNKYAFDAWKDSYAGKPVLDSSYEKLADGKYRVSAKAIAPGVQETVTATLENDAPDMAAKISFVSGKGISYPFERNGNSFTVTITGGPAGDAQEVYAVYQDSSKYKSLGKLLVASYAPLQKKVVLIPIGAETTVPEQEILNSLQQAYNKISVHYTVTTDNSFRGNKDWDLDHNDILQDTKSAFLSNNFTGEEKALKQAYSKGRSLDDDAVYLFLVNEAALRDGDLLGKMPRQSQFGFIFVKNATAESIGHTVAHETGHGAYTLEHTFSAGIGLAQGSTDNLMDYNNGYGLLKYQWDVVHDPGNVWGVFEGDGESQLVTGYYWDPAGYPVYIPASAGIVNVKSIEEGKTVNGILYGWKLGDDTYEASIAGNLFKGYYNKSTGAFYAAGYQLKAGQRIEAISLMYRGNCLVDYVSNQVVAKGNSATEETYKQGLPLVTVFDYVKGTLKKQGVGILDCVTDGANVSLADGTLAKDFYDTQVGMAKDSLAQKELVKLAQLVDKLGRDFYNQYVAEVKDHYDPLNYNWLDFPIRYHDSAYTAQNVKDAYNKLKQFYDAIQRLQFGDFKDKDELLEFINTYFVAGGSLVKKFYTTPFKPLTSSRRVALMEYFLEGSMPGRLSIGGDVQEEDIVLAIVETVPVNSAQPADILTALQDKKWLYNFIDGLNGDNFNRFVAKLTEWINKVYPAPQKGEYDMVKMLRDKRVVLFNNNYFGRRNSEDIYKDGSVHLTVRKWFGDGPEYKIDCSPYEYIQVTFKNNFEMPGSAGFAKEQAYKLPAIYVYMLFNDDTKKKWLTTGKVTIDIALVAVGATEIKAAIQAGNWVSASLAIADMGIGLGDIVISTAFENEIKDKYPEFAKNWQIISTVYGIGRLAQIGLESVYKKCYSESTLIAADQSLSVEARETAERIENELKNPEQFAEFMDNLQDVFYTHPSRPPNPAARPRGVPTEIPPTQKDRFRIRSLTRENEAAETLSKNGFDVEQNPVIPGTKSEPDYLIEGKVFDCYAPWGDNLDDLFKVVVKKVEKKGQTDRILLNLSDWTGDLDVLKMEFLNREIKGLKEVKCIGADGSIFNFRLKLLHE